MALFTLQTLLHFTFLECWSGFTITLGPFGVNLLWLWLQAPEALDPSVFTLDMAMGYGFWAGSWLIPNYVISTSRETNVRRLFSRLLSVVYVLWWVYWFKSLFVYKHWQWYVLVIFVPIRGYQALGHLYYGWIAGDALVAHPSVVAARDLNRQKSS
eukprot:TRINITY_DN2864_c0_g1_i3.p1 TRINITY_DN2864_c0_g1~~TRINITY_DN2864_c0_g1_i3.p1  ORF type:complete len:176 (-),score=8.41 TRINITY_DN2864_c0_g1_i3:126-593(-)